MFCNFGTIVKLKYRNDELYMNPSQEVWDIYNGDKIIQKTQKDKMKKNSKTLGRNILENQLKNVQEGETIY